ncbi:MAG: TetR/AcrR family transcriptional regulator [Bacteroidales bacterium]|nr:TetR/AcrR family transcriptional regulator [Bacteroidales bacterium]
MESSDVNTEKRIMEAARVVFLRKGMEGSRMQEIADEAGINKALLHYYFRSKERLFEAIFRETLQQAVPDFTSILGEDIPIFRKIELFTERYNEMLRRNPLIPGFVIHELNRSPQRVAGMIKGSGINPAAFIRQILDEIDRGEVRPLNPLHLMVNMIALCVFPFVARPIMQHIFFDDDEAGYNEFISERNEEVASFINNSIRNR